MKLSRILYCVGSVAFAACAPASAQTAASPSAAAPPPQTDVQGDKTLSEKLSETNGVIHPKSDVDAAIRTVAPPDPSAATTMPVIPPPGSPGGDPTVQPK